MLKFIFAIAFWPAFFLFTGKLAQLLSRIFLAKELGPAEFGLFTIGMAVISLSGMVGTLGVHKSIMKFFASAKGERAQLPASFLYMSIGSVVLGSGMLAALLYGVQSYSSVSLLVGYDTEALWLLCLGMMAYSLLLVSSHLLWSRGKHVGYLFVEQTAVAVLFLVLLAFGWANHLHEALGAYAAALWAVAGSVVLYYLVTTKRKATLPTLPRKDFYRYGMTALIATASYVALTATDRLILNHFVSMEEIGLYGVAFTIAALIPSLLIVADAYTAPRFAVDFKNNNIANIAATYKQCNHLMLYIASATCVAILVVKDMLVGIFGAEYAIAAHYLVWLVMGEYITIIFGTSGRMLMLGGEERFETRTVIAMLLLNIILNLLLIPHYGVYGALISTVGARLLHVALKAWRVWIIWGLSPWETEACWRKSFILLLTLLCFILLAH